jgi:hypothetical protein
LSGLPGRELSADGVRVVTAGRGSAVIECDGAQLTFRRDGFSCVEAVRVGSGGESTPVARFRSVPKPTMPDSFVEIDPGVSRAELTIVAVGMASGVVLLVRRLARLAVANWLFPWQRPVFVVPRSMREHWLTEVLPGQ